MPLNKKDFLKVIKNPDKHAWVAKNLHNDYDEKMAYYIIENFNDVNTKKYICDFLSDEAYGSDEIFNNLIPYFDQNTSDMFNIVTYLNDNHKEKMIKQKEQISTIFNEYLMYDLNYLYSHPLSYAIFAVLLKNNYIDLENARIKQLEINKKDYEEMNDQIENNYNVFKNLKG